MGLYALFSPLIELQQNVNVKGQGHPKFNLDPLIELQQNVNEDKVDKNLKYKLTFNRTTVECK